MKLKTIFIFSSIFLIILGTYFFSLGLQDGNSDLWGFFLVSGNFLVLGAGVLLALSILKKGGFKTTKRDELNTGTKVFRVLGIALLLVLLITVFALFFTGNYLSALIVFLVLFCALFGIMVVYFVRQYQG